MHITCRYDLFEKILVETLAERGASDADLLVSFNPELAPQNMLFEQAVAIEKIPPKRRAQAQARLREIVVVLIRTLISDQLAYLKIAKDWFTIQDLIEIRNRKIGHGKIGGKSAGMLLAPRILASEADESIRSHLRIPESFFIGADLTYTFMSMNGLMVWGDQKYKTEEQIRADYPHLQQDFLAGQFPPDIIERLQGLLDVAENRPLIVRSSSLLEDNFGTSFAGKYESHFCPNQGSPQENLQTLTQAMARIYASIHESGCAALPACPRAARLRRTHGNPDPGCTGRPVRALFPAAGSGGGIQPQSLPLVASDPPGGRLYAPGMGVGDACG